MNNGAAILDAMLDPISRCFNLDAARALAAMHVDAITQARVDALAEKCNEGSLTPDERSEYESYVQAGTLIGVLQAKARRILTAASREPLPTAALVEWVDKKYGAKKPRNASDDLIAERRRARRKK